MAGPIRVSQVWGGEAVPLLRDFFSNFKLKSRVLCIFIAKNNLWPETGTGGGEITDSPGG